MECLMPLFTSEVLVENLRGTNVRLGCLLDSLHADTAEKRSVTPQRMAGLLSELMRAGQWLRQMPSEKTSQLEKELNEYRTQVERLRDILPSIHKALLRDRSRLEQERARVQSAAAWAHSSRQTL
jgi:hypothetical protein